MKFNFSKNITSSYIGNPEDDITIVANKIDGLWAIYKDDVVSTTNFYRGNHYDWFIDIGFPTKNPEFDKVIRGYFSIDNNVLKITITVGDYEEVIDKSNRLIDTIGHKDAYSSFEFYYKNQRIAKKSFKFHKESDIKGVIDKVWKWFKDKLSEEKSTEIQLRKKLPKEVEKELEKTKGVEDSKEIIDRVVNTIIDKAKDEDLISETTEKPKPKDEEEIKKEIEDGGDGEENDIVTNAVLSAKAYKLLWIQYRDKKGNVTERSIEPWEIRPPYLYAHDPKFTKHHRSDVGTRRFILAAVLNSKLTKKDYVKKDRWKMMIT